MPPPYNASSAARDRSGLTLIEVVASSVLLATLLALLLTAAGAHLRQVRRAQLRLDAVAGLERLLLDAAGGNRAGPLNVLAAQGPLPGAPGLEWTSRRERRPEADAWRAAVVRFEVREARHPRSAALAAVELLVPQPAQRKATP